MDPAQLLHWLAVRDAAKALADAVLNAPETSTKTVDAHIDALTDRDLAAAIIEAWILDHQPVDYQGDVNDTFTTTCATFGVDLKALAKAAEAKAPKDKPEPKSDPKK